MEYTFNACEDLWSYLKNAPDPRVRTYFIHQLHESSLDATNLLERLPIESDPSVQYAILVAISHFEPSRLPESEQLKLTEWLRENYLTHPDCGVHGMCRTLLRQRGEHTFLQSATETLSRQGRCSRGIGTSIDWE